MIPSPGFENRRILIIDDNEAIHADFRKIFASGTAASELDELESELFGPVAKKHAQADFAIESATQGQQGYQMACSAKAAGKPYSVAFVDVRMPPGWDGIETIARIWEVYPDLQVVICTAFSDYSWDEMLAKIGTSDRVVLLRKPFEKIEVLQLAQTLTKKWNLLQQMKIQIENVETTPPAHSG